jgi:hypothetical protein
MVSWAISEITGKAFDSFFSPSELFCLGASGFNSQLDKKEHRQKNNAKA